jgi:Nucleotide modification associated domain 1
VSKTNFQYDEAVAGCRNIFVKKVKDYGTSWRILRLESLTDQIFIKAQRIRTIEQNGSSKVNEGVEDEFRGIINYAVIALIQIDLSDNDPINLSEETALKLYNEKIGDVKKLMLDKNHDYGEAWRDMRVGSFTDLILMKLLRVKQIEENDGKTLISEGVASHYMDMINYSIFALIKLSENEK